MEHVMGRQRDVRGICPFIMDKRSVRRGELGAEEQGDMRVQARIGWDSLLRSQEEERGEGEREKEEGGGEGNGRHRSRWIQ